MSLKTNDLFIVQRGNVHYQVPFPALKNSLSQAAVIVSDTPPSGPNQEGDLWWSTIDTNLYIWYNDGNSSQWVDASPQGDGTGTGGIPEAPEDGLLYARQNKNWTAIPTGGSGGGSYTFTRPLIEFGGSVSIDLQTLSNA